MSIVLVAIHVIVCISLIMIVLLQTGKGADMGAAFGGGSSQTLFGSTGASTFLGKATTVAAVVFMLTSFILAYKSSNPTGDSIMRDMKPATPIEEKTQPAVPDQKAGADLPEQGGQQVADTAQSETAPATTADTASGEDTQDKTDQDAVAPQEAPTAQPAPADEKETQPKGN